jgi:hypothetical protein
MHFDPCGKICRLTAVSYEGDLALGAQTLFYGHGDVLRVDLNRNATIGRHHFGPRGLKHLELILRIDKLSSKRVDGVSEALNFGLQELVLLLEGFS